MPARVLAAELDALVDPGADRRFEYFSLRTMTDRYLLRRLHTRLVVETPQHWLLRVSCGLARDVTEAGQLYRLMSSLAYLPSSPTLFNSGTAHPQMSSGYLLNSPRDDLDSIYQWYAQVARLSKFAAGEDARRPTTSTSRTGSRMSSCAGCGPTRRGH